MREDLERIFMDPVLFAKAFFGFDATPYQAKFLRDPSKRIVLRWSRQSGKSTFLAIRALYYAMTHPETLTLLVAPSLRQSMITRDKIEDQLMRVPLGIRRLFVRKLLRTVVTFKNGSRIIALPNSPQLLRGYTAHTVICDEAAFFVEDELVFYNVLYPMLATTDGTLIVSSTPWGRDSIFYRFCNSPEFSRHVVTWRDAVEAGLTTQGFIEEMRLSLTPDQFQREFEAEFTEDADTWLPQSLIAKCIDPDLEFFDFNQKQKGEFYVGADFGKHQDYSVVAVIQKIENRLNIVHVHRFKLETPYASVIGYIKTLSERWGHVAKVCCDISGVGDYIVEDMKNGGIQGVEGIQFTAPQKEKVATILKQKMLDGLFKLPYDRDLIAELNVEGYELRKTGNIIFSHPEGTKDDRFWAVALACYAATVGREEPARLARAF